MNDRASIACSLTADDYQLRLAAIRKIGNEALLDSDERPDGATLTFRYSREVREQLTAIVRAESECCPFLVLDLDEHHDRLVLAITAPPEARQIVDDVVRNFTIQ